MKIHLLLMVAGASLSLQSHAEWFVRGSHNNWAADLMHDVGNNTRVADNIAFSEDGSIKFDRFGDWSENYGIGGQNGGDIPVAGGIWDIEFYTDTKNWKILDPDAHSIGPVDYYFRGTTNNWAEDAIMTPVPGQTGLVQTCQNFTGNTEPRFKIDPNGGWGGDEFPAADISVSASWVHITVDTTSNTVASVQEGLGADCGQDSDSDGDGVPDSLDQCPDTPVGTPVDSTGCEIPQGVTYHIRGTNNDWAEGTLLSPVANSTNYDICVNFTRGDEDGGPRFKIDPNGGWGDGFPEQDVNVQPGFAYIVVDSATNSIVSVEDGLGTDCSEPLADFRSRTIYFLFVDRFENGDVTNDNGNNPNGTSQIGATGGVGEWRKYWGGDIQGLIDRLDYLEELGVSAIWVTPLTNATDNTSDFTQNPVVHEGAYHGYWTRDFFEVDEHLGNWELVRELDAKMEEKGMKLILDIALNHSNQDDAFEFGLLEREGEYVTDYNNDDGTWYHRNGNITDCNDNDPTTNNCFWEWDSEWHLRNKTLFHLADFNHGVDSNSPADQYLIDAAAKWVANGVDAFRIDAIKHIEPNFINRFSAAMRAIRPDIYIFGEWFGAGVDDGASIEFLNANRGSELLDFGLRDNIEKAIADDISMIDLNAHIESRPAAMQNREDWQPIFLDNHDDTRTSVYLQANGPVSKNVGSQPRQGKNWPKGYADERQNLGMAMVMTLPGIPTVYYGTEQNSTWFGFDPRNGRQGADPFNREPMPSFSRETAAYKLISKLAKLRKESPAIQRGSYTQKWVDGDILVFERNEGSDSALIAVNKGAAKTISVNGISLENGDYTNHVGNEIVTISNGQAQLVIGENQAIVLHK